MLGLNKVVTNVQQVQWTITSNFYVEMKPKEDLIKNAVGWTTNTVDFQEVMQMSIKNIDLPQHTADLVEKMIAGKWHISRNEDEIFVVSITFRDMWAGALYRMFKNIWNLGKQLYPNYSTFSIKIYLTHGNNNNNFVVYNVDDAFLTSISQIQLSHENAEILEFTVEFKSNEPTADYTKGITNFKGQQIDLSSLTTFKQGLAGQYTEFLQKGLSKLTSLAKDFLSSKSSSLSSTVSSKVKGFLGW